MAQKDPEKKTRKSKKKKREHKRMEVLCAPGLFGK